MGNIQTVGPNEALVVSGGCCCSTTRHLFVGGWAWVWWLIGMDHRLSLEVMTIRPWCENVATAALGVSVTVTAVAHCRVMTEPELLAAACERFLGHQTNYIKGVIIETLERHLEAVLGTLTIDEVYQNRHQFASLVRKAATPDVTEMGIEIVCFTIKDIVDDEEYLTSLGKARIAALREQVDIKGVEAKPNTGIREPEYEKASLAWKEGYKKVVLRQRSSSALLRH